MFRTYLLLFFGGFLITGGTAVEEILSKDVSNSQAPEETIAPLKKLGENRKPSDSVRSMHSMPVDATPNEVQRQSDWPFFPVFDPNLFFNPYYNLISSSLFKSLVDQYKNDLEMIRHRQNMVLKYAECSCPNSDKCMKVNQPDGTEDLRALNYWNWGYRRPDSEYVTSDRFYAVMNSFKSSIEKLALRQNTLYEYVECSCTAMTECSTSIKPVLDVMFSNNENTTRQLIESLFVPGSSYYNPASSFFQMLASYFSQIPSWFAYNYSPLASAFGSFHPFSTSPVSSSSASSSTPVTSSSATTMPVSSTYATTSPQTTQTTPASSSSWESYSTGSQPVHSSSSSYSSTTGSGQQVSGGYVSTGGGGKPSQEQYFVSSNGENIHISSSTDDKGVSVSSVGSGRQIRRFADGLGSGINPGFEAGEVKINAAQVGINAAQAGIQAAQFGINAAQLGVQVGAAAAQQGVNAANAGIAAGLLGAHVPYY